MGGAITGDGEGTKEKKERRLAASKLREVPSIFSAVVAPINEDDNTVRPEGLNDIGP